MNCPHVPFTFRTQSCATHHATWPLCLSVTTCVVEARCLPVVLLGSPSLALTPVRGSLGSLSALSPRLSPQTLAVARNLSDGVPITAACRRRPAKIRKLFNLGEDEDVKK